MQPILLRRRACINFLNFDKVSLFILKKSFNNDYKACFIRRISVASNAIQTIVNITMVVDILTMFKFQISREHSGENFVVEKCQVLKYLLDIEEVS